MGHCKIEIREFHMCCSYNDVTQTPFAYAHDALLSSLFYVPKYKWYILFWLCLMYSCYFLLVFVQKMVVYVGNGQFCAGLKMF